jgi:arsenite methyltransferase
LTQTEELRQIVRERYAEIGADRASCCGGAGCCSSTPSAASQPTGGGCCPPAYPPQELEGLPPGADLGLGCGNPTGLLSLKPGETVLDLGSGGGIDCFLAAKKVGPTGKAIGVDMTPEMVTRARINSRRSGLSNVEFRLGEAEHLPAADQSVDVVLSNCVINLVPDKLQVYREAFRVLRAGGRLALSDMVATRPIPQQAREDPRLWAGCSSGALSVDRMTELLEEAGFTDIEITLPGVGEGVAPDSLGVVAANILARRPAEPSVRS